jgi:hypothetical protein
MPTREELDQIAWTTIHAKPKLVLSQARGSRPKASVAIAAVRSREATILHLWN